ncbi:ATP-binding protein [Thomasclavelia saccharogumia]|uniref:ATP-binding protein n=1 Tax=Thomasclavelia saccharogumia TaxID=341225 RepID=UPI00047B64D4|nr:ATP-binding protein [Thomasclavelia saccharogumia]
MKLYKRENYLKKIRGFYEAEDIIKVITGVRRCGKSSLMQTIAEELISNGISKENIIYIDLDKREFRKIKDADQLEIVIDKKIENIEGLKYLFIDEVQNVNGFEEVLNGFRNEGEYSIFITGSNSYLLSGELITKLTGRYIEFEMFTLSLEEYIDMKKFYNKTVSSNLLEELNSYILEGGFPRTVQMDNLADKRTYTQSVIKEIFEKDIRRRIKVRDRDAFEIVKNFIINNYGSLISINSIVNSLRKTGTLISKATVTRYIQALLDAKIIYECYRFDMKSKKAIKGEKKYYIADLSFYYALNTDNQMNYGPCLENIVYIYARSQDYSVSIGRIGKLECDFILRDRELNYSYVQVSYTIMLNKETEDREYKPLEQIKDNYPKYVATTDYLLQKRNGIKHINIIDFMKNNELF